MKVGRRRKKMLKAARLAERLARMLEKYVVPAESGPRRKETRHAPLDTPEDAGASYGSNWGPVG